MSSANTLCRSQYFPSSLGRLRIKPYLCGKKQGAPNLTLLEQPINGAIKNNPYVDKAPTYAASAFYLTRSLHHLDEIGVDTAITRINKYLKPFDHWDADTIAERQEIYYNLSKEIWKVE